MGDTASGHVILGRLGAPYGIRGWMKLISYTDPAENILEYSQLLIREAQGFRVIEIDESKHHGKGFVAHVKGCDDRDQTRGYTGQELWVATDELPSLTGEEFYWHQLENLQVRNLAGQLLGSVARMMETGANDVMVLRPVTGSIDDEERLVPWIPDQVVREVNLVTGTIVVDWDSSW